MKISPLMKGVLGLMVFASQTGIGGTQGTLADYERAGEIFSGRYKGMVFSDKIVVNWIGDTPRFWYRNEIRDATVFMLVDAEKGTKTPAFDQGKLAVALNNSATGEFKAENLPFEKIEFVDDEKAVRFKVKDDWYKCTLDLYVCTKIDSPTDAEKKDESGKKRRDEPEKKSPDGKWEAFTEDNNLYVKSTEKGERIRLSLDGEEEFYYDSPVFSPDSKKVAALRIKKGDRKRMYMIESLPKDELRPKLQSNSYDLPGDKVDMYEPWIFDIEKKTQVKADIGMVDWDWSGGPPIHWHKAGDRIFQRRMYRGYLRVKVVRVHVETGESKDIIDETSDIGIDPGKEILEYLDDTNEIVWMSERDGWKHLYLYNSETGELKNQITKGEWIVRGVEHVDEKARQVYFSASGREEGEDPYLAHYYRINLDGTGLVLLTPGNAHHSAQFSPDKKYMVDSYSRVDSAPVHVLRNANDGSIICEVEKADIEKLLATGWKFPEPFKAKGRDGVTDIYGVIFRPMNLDESRKYPIVEEIYTGPQWAYTPKAFGTYYWCQALAELGFIVVQADGMGTALRSKAFRAVSNHNLGDGGFPDRIAWMRAVAERYPYIDITRVGLEGGSAGGYDTVRGLLMYPDFYKAGASNAGNHDHRTDKVWWNELWMGYPVGEHYKEQSNVTNADKLKGKLLLIHGELDSNVYMSAGTLPLVDALIKANKDFDLLIVPGAGHCPGGPYVVRRRWDFFVRHLLGVEPPKDFKLVDKENNKARS